MRTRFRIVGADSGELLLRVLNLFVQQALVVEALSAVHEGDRYRIDIDVSGGAPARIELVGEKVRALVLVIEVATADMPERVAA